MGEFIRKASIVLALFVYIYFLYIFMRKNIKSIKSLKRLSLYFNGLCNISKESFWEVIKIIHLIILGLIPFIWFFIKSEYHFPNILPSIGILKSIVVVLVAFIGVLQVTLFVIVVVVEMILGKDSRAEMSKIYWIKFNRKKPLYTGVIRPIFYSAGEMLIFYYLIFNILIYNCKFSYFETIFIVSLLYSFSKIIAVKNIYQGLIYGIWSFLLSFCAGCLLIYSGGSILIFIIFAVYAVLISFKE